MSLRNTSHSNPRVDPVPSDSRGIILTVSNNTLSHSMKMAKRELRFPKNVKSVQASWKRSEVENDNGVRGGERMLEGDVGAVRVWKRESLYQPSVVSWERGQMVRGCWRGS